MDLEFTPEQEDLRAAVRAVLTRECPTSLVRDIVEKGASPSALWHHMVELDWPALTLPESCGGLGGTFVELAVVAEELGRVICPGPLLPTISQYTPLVRELGSDAEQQTLLGEVAAGRTGSVALAELAGSWRIDDVTVTATQAGGEWRLAGSKSYVMEGGRVDSLAVVGREAGSAGRSGIGVWIVPASACTVAPIVTLDASRQLATIDLTGAAGVPLTGVADEEVPERLERALSEATVALSIETLGVCQSIFDIALQYAKDRHQFGVPIGSFQAMKHKFVNMFVALQRARAACYFAAATIAEHDPRRALATSMAKAAAGDCQALLAQEGIQTLGGVGYTWEHDMHLFVKRAKTCDSLFGSAREHRAAIAGAIGV